MTQHFSIFSSVKSVDHREEDFLSDCRFTQHPGGVDQSPAEHPQSPGQQPSSHGNQRQAHRHRLADKGEKTRFCQSPAKEPLTASLYQPCGLLRLVNSRFTAELPHLDFPGFSSSRRECLVRPSGVRHEAGVRGAAAP